MLRLKEARERTGMSQSAVAKALGISRQSYNYYENGKRDPDTPTLQAMADLLLVSTDYLLGRDETLEDPALALARRIKLLPPDVRQNIEQQVALWAEQDK